MTFQILRCYILLFACTVLITFAAIVLLSNKRIATKIERITKHNQKQFFWIILILGFISYIISIIGYMGVEKFVRDFDVFFDVVKNDIR